MLYFRLFLNDYPKRETHVWILHPNTLRINNRSHGWFAAVSGAARHDRTMTWR